MISDCRLFLITPPLALADVERFAPAFEAAARAGSAASALIRFARGAEGDAKRISSPLVSIAQRLDVALIVEDDARLAARAGADGVQVAGAGAALMQALESLHPERIVGAGRLKLRDEAMTAGEAGADYVMFGEPRPDGFTPPFAETLQRASWWAEIFETPCVAHAATLDEAATLSAAGVDFVALGDAVFSAADPAAAAAAAVRRMAAAAELRS